MLIHQNINTDDICRVPLGYKKSIPLPGLMTLKSFIEGGHEVGNCKVLLYVKSIGRKKNITSKKSGQAMELLEVTLMDDTGEIVLKLWRELAASAKVWEAGKTILLFSSPVLKDELWRRKATLAVGSKTMVDVEPSFQDAEWLRKWARNLKRRECVKQDIPEDVWDVESAEGGVLRVLFTLADVDDLYFPLPRPSTGFFRHKYLLTGFCSVRDDPRKVFTGFLSLIIIDLHMVITRQRNMLMVTEWYVSVHHFYPIPLFLSMSLFILAFSNPSSFQLWHPPILQHRNPQMPTLRQNPVARPQPQDHRHSHR
jgi:hypothetical protein